MPCRNTLNRRLPFPKHNRRFRELKKELSRKKFDLAVINANFYPHRVFAAKLSKKQGAPAITISHGSSNIPVANPFLDRVGAAYKHFITDRLKRFCKSYYGVSDAACRWLRHFDIEPRGTLYNAVDPDDLTAAGENPVCDWRAELGIPKDALFVTYAGRLVPEKGAAKLAEGFSAANIKTPSCLSRETARFTGP